MKLPDKPFLSLEQILFEIKRMKDEAYFKNAEILEDAIKWIDYLNTELTRYQNDENSGLLVRFPQKSVFELTWDAGENCDLVCPLSIDGEGQCDFCDKGELFVYERPCTQELLSHLGKTVYLTPQEAEDARIKEIS